MSEVNNNQKITEEMIAVVKSLIGNKEEVNIEWLKTVTQYPLTVISRIVIQSLNLVVLEGIVITKGKAERKLAQKQLDAQTTIDRESFRKSPVKIDMMKLREKLWTVNLPERVFGQERHQFCPIWSFLEESQSAIVLRYDWITRLESLISAKTFINSRIIKAKNIMNELGENYKNRASVIFAKTIPRDSIFEKNKSIWIMFLVSLIEGGVRLEGLNMINILSLSTKFRSRELAYNAMNEYISLVNYLVNEPLLFEEVIIAK